jgi:hypothetical protein
MPHERQVSQTTGVADQPRLGREGRASTCWRLRSGRNDKVRLYTFSRHRPFCTATNSGMIVTIQSDLQQEGGISQSDNTYIVLISTNVNGSL